MKKTTQSRFELKPQICTVNDKKEGFLKPLEGAILQDLIMTEKLLT